MSTIRSFMFHDVRNIEDSKYPDRYKLKSFISDRQFLHQIDQIQKKYKIVGSLESVNLDLRHGNTDYATLTFDDGLRDHYKVYKMLKERDATATFLVPKNAIEQMRVMNTHKIQFILASTHEHKIKDEILSYFDNKDEIWNEFSKSKWKNNWWSDEMIFVTNFLRKFKSDKIDNFELTNNLFYKFVTKDETSFARDLYLSLSNIEEMSQQNMTIGGHGTISENLLLIDDFKADLDESKKFVTSYCDSFVFSYPNGGFNEQIKDHLRSIDCKIAYTTVPCTLTDLDDVDYLEYPRYDAPQKLSLS